MHVTLITLMLLSRKVALSEAPTEETTTILNITTHMIEILNTLPIDPPVLDPLEDPWLPIDNRIEFILATFSSTSASPNRNLDASCQAKDERAEAIRIPSYPNIISFLEEMQQTEGLDSLWILNIVSTVSREKATLGLCHQLVLPIPSNQKELTRIGQRSDAPIM